MAAFTIIDDSVPAGRYRARFLGVKPIENQFGPGLKFGFQIIEGKSADAVVTRICSGRPTIRNSTGKLLAGLAGQQPAAGMQIDPEEHKHCEYWITVASAREGGVRVEGIEPVR